MEKITIDKQIIFDLAKQISDLNDKMETLEIMSDPNLMESLKKSREQISKGELVEFDDL